MSENPERSRWIRANHELRRQFPELARSDKRRYGGSPRFILQNTALWIDLVPFGAIYLAAEIRAITTRRRGPTWSTSRVLAMLAAMMPTEFTANTTE